MFCEQDSQDVPVNLILILMHCSAVSLEHKQNDQIIAVLWYFVYSTLLIEDTHMKPP